MNSDEIIQLNVVKFLCGINAVPVSETSFCDKGTEPQLKLSP